MKPGKPICARCGGPGENFHHWAPIAIFGRVEADRWPRAWLCHDCHGYWHDAIARRRREDLVEDPEFDDRAPDTLHIADAMERVLDDWEKQP